MSKRPIALALVLLLSLSGCHVRKVYRVAPTTVVQADKELIIGITTVKGEDVSFDVHGATISNGILTGTVKNAPYQIPLAEVQRLWIQKDGISTARTIGLVAGVLVGTVAVVAGVIAATKQSCPFVYAWDGHRYVFDAEPYGGAITRGLEKDDYSELGQLREDKGEYKLKVTNEVDETQLTNLTELWVVDHPVGTRVVTDVQGKLHTVGTPLPPTSAHDDSGKDLLPWLSATDRKIWEPSSVPGANGKLQSTIEMTFPKPADAHSVKLVANAATGLWGSYMIKKMVALRGRDVGAWYKKIDESQPARDQLAAWEVKEQLYALKIYVEEPGGWKVRGVLPGTGPFISKDRIVNLDVSHVQGSELHIKIEPPAGFWALNSFGVDYTNDSAISVQTVQPAMAVDDGKDVLADLVASDDRYLAMPNIGDTADLTFTAPPLVVGSERTVFLHSRGYYKLHFGELGKPDTKTLTAIQFIPGSAARFAAKNFGEWQMAAK
jgi:hypothetical protein